MVHSNKLIKNNAFITLLSLLLLSLIGNLILVTFQKDSLFYNVF